MSEITQLTRITVPAITDTRYIEGMADAFDKINDNFKKIASLPFLQGVQGDSYQLEEYKIWDDWSITEDGKVLLDSIFGKDVTVDGNSFNAIRGYIGEELDGVSPLDFFVAEDENTIINNALYFYVIKDDTGNVIEKQLGQYYYFVDGRLKKIGNVYNGDITGVSLEGFNDYTGFYQYRYNPKSYEQKYLKVEILPSIYYDQNKNDICWKFNGNETGISAIGVKGADGKDADLLIVKVTANENDCTGVVVAMINPISGNTAEYKWIDDPSDFKAGKALICIQNAKGDAQDFAYGQVIQAGDGFNAYWEPNYNFSKLIGNNRITNYFYNMGDDDTETSPFYLAIPSSYNRGASGTITDKQKAHVIKGSSETSEDLNIFYSEDAFIKDGEQNPDVTGSTTITKNLNIQNYNTNITKKLTVSGSAEVSDGLSIQNGGLSVKAGDLLVADNATISKKLIVSGSAEVSSGLTVNSGKFIASSGAEVSGGLTVKNGGAVISSGGIQVTTEKPAAPPKTGKDANVSSNVLKGYNDPGDGAYNYFPNDITKGGYPLVTMSYDGNGAESKDCMVFGNGDICALTWNGTKYEPGTLCLQDIYKYSGKTKVGGSFEVGGTSKLNGITTITNITDSTGTTYGALVVSGGAGIAKSLYVGGTTNIGGTTKIGSTQDSTGTTYGALVVSGGAGIAKSLYVGGTTNIGGTTKIGSTQGSTGITNGALVVTGGVGIGGAVNIGGTTRITNGTDSTGTGSGVLVVSGGAGIAKSLYVGGTTNIGGTTKIGSTQGSTGTTSGALVITGGVGIGKQLYVGNKITGNYGIKIINGNDGGIGMYSGTGSTKDSNYLRINSTNVLIGGGVGSLQLAGSNSSLSVDGAYDSGKETGSNLSAIANANHPGHVYLGAAPNDTTLPINRLLLNRHAIQAYTTYGGTTKNEKGEVVSVYKSPTASAFRINPCGGDVIINNTSSTTTINGPLRVNGNVLTDLTVNGKIKGTLNEGYVTWNNTITTDSKGNRVYDLKTINQGTVSPIGAAWSNIGSNNAFALFKSTFDGKATNNWGYMYKTASGALTDINKGKFTEDTLFNLFNNNSASIYIGHQTSTPSAGESTTIQIFANSIKKAGSTSDTYTTFYYGKIKKILFLVAKGGCELALTIKGNDPKGNSVTIVDNYSLAGDSGWNEVPLNITFGGNRQGLDSSGNVSDFQRFYSLSFTFTIKSVYSGYTPRAVLKGIRVLSDIQWELNAFKSTNMSKSGHIYTYDKDANTTFPAKVTASKGLTVSAGVATINNGATITGNLTVNKLLKARIMKSMENTAYLTIGDGTQIYDEYIYSKVTTGNSHLYITFNPPSGWSGVVKLVILVLVTGGSHGDKTIYFKTNGDTNYKQLKYAGGTKENYYDNGGHTMVELYYNGACWGVIHSPVGSHAHKAVWD